jgi:MtN3 and saliva related transmembrane protein
MNFTIGTIIGIVASLLTSFSYVPQVNKMWRTKSVSDISPTTIFQMVVGCLLWEAYGILRGDLIIIGANIVAITVLVFAVTFYYRYRKK